MSKERRQLRVLVDCRLYDYDGGGGDMGDRVAVQYRYGGFTECDRSWGYGTEGYKVEYGYMVVSIML